MGKTALLGKAAGGRLYCFGGGLFPNNVYNNVQIYQP
jgi:hypothetical protein